MAKNLEAWQYLKDEKVFVCNNCGSRLDTLDSDEGTNGETLSSTEEMSDDSDVEMTDSFIVDDDDEDFDGIPKASINYKDSDDSYEPSEDNE